MTHVLRVLTEVLIVRHYLWPSPREFVLSFGLLKSTMRCHVARDELCSPRPQGVCACWAVPFRFCYEHPVVVWSVEVWEDSPCSE
jgi:hypothetical protein